MDALLAFYKSARRMVILTGAGISTESGIPDYRSPGRPPSNPMMYQDFLASLDTRRRYWGRGLIGYTRFSSAAPNSGHRAVAEIQKQGRCHGVITQNVDGFHQAAGATNVIELHGNLHHVHCLDCGTLCPREEFQAELIRQNQVFYDYHSERILRKKELPDEGLVAPSSPQKMKPDGDVDLDSEDFSSFVLPRCGKCDGVNVKPDVVFMGGQLRPEVAEAAKHLMEGADSLLVLGSTLPVYSSFRLAKMAKTKGIPLAVVNRGLTRADTIADIKIEDNVSAVLHQLLPRA